ncbi:MAG: four helix bundle protein [Balneola sp.]|jgi:four helix bundle protein
MIKLNHKKLNVYKSSIELVSEIYKLTSTFPSSENFGLISQLRRASVSIPSNIAEGSARSSDTERKRFLQIARSSLVEVDTQIEIALTLNYLNEKDIEHLSDLSNQVFAMLSKMMQ